MNEKKIETRELNLIADKGGSSSDRLHNIRFLPLWDVNICMTERTYKKYTRKQQ